MPNPSQFEFFPPSYISGGQLIYAVGKAISVGPGFTEWQIYEALIQLYNSVASTQASFVQFLWTAYITVAGVTVTPSKYISALPKYALGSFGFTNNGFVVADGFINYFNQRLGTGFVTTQYELVTSYTGQDSAVLPTIADITFILQPGLEFVGGPSPNIMSANEVYTNVPNATFVELTISVIASGVTPSSGQKYYSVSF